jgi:hypothetical protein
MYERRHTLIERMTDGGIVRGLREVLAPRLFWGVWTRRSLDVVVHDRFGLPSRRMQLKVRGDGLVALDGRVLVARGDIADVSFGARFGGAHRRRLVEGAAVGPVVVEAPGSLARTDAERIFEFVLRAGRSLTFETGSASDARRIMEWLDDATLHVRHEPPPTPPSGAAGSSP